MQKWSQVIRSVAPVTQNYFSKPVDLTLKNAPVPRNSVPWPPNMTDSCVSGTAPARRNSSSNVPRLPTFLKLLQTVHVLLIFGKVRNRCACHTKRLQYPKMVRACGVFNIFTSKCAPRDNSVHFLNISTPKVLRTWQFLILTFLTSKCASRHNGVHFFHISTSKSAPNMWCFVHFDFEMCCGTTPCTFSTFQSLKALRHWGVFSILTWKCASRHIGVQVTKASLCWLKLLLL